MTSQNFDVMAANPFSLPSAKKKGANPEDGQDFLSLMNQTMMRGSDLVGPNVQQTEVITNLKADSGGTDFSRKDPIRTVMELHGTQTSSGPVTEDQVVDAREAMKGFEADVKDAITEELSITEEELEDAMEVLGLSFADLLDPANLKDLLLKVSGQDDPSVLLVSDSMKDLFLQIQSIAQDDLGQLSLDPGQWQLVEEQGEVLSDGDLAALLNEAAQGALEESAVSGNESNTIISTEEKSAPVLERPAPVLDSDAPMEDSDIRTMAEDQQNALTIDAAKDTGDGDDQAKQQSFGQERHTSSSARQADPAGAAAGAAVPQANVTADFQGELVSAVSKYSSIDTDDVIAQIIREAKTNITSQVRTMEMELNPQSLGRMIMQVVEKNGDISARLFAQDEAVKHALENRLADLQEKLKEAGIKVNEITIAVGTHAFEENLEKGNTQHDAAGQFMSDSFGAGDDPEGTSDAGRRNRDINLSMDDVLLDDMTEAEALEVSIMRDLGNTVSYTV